MKENSLQLILSADLHGYLPRVPDCDIFLIAGDVAPARLPLDEQKVWSEKIFRPWLASLAAKKIVWIAGNHDTFVLESEFMPSHFASYLQESTIDVFGLKIYGFPWVAQERDGLFYLPEDEMQKRIQEIPECDILLSHSPPFSILDLYTGGHAPELCGLPDLLEQAKEKVDLLTLTGHVHEGFGIWPEEPRIINASYVDQDYRARGKMFSALVGQQEDGSHNLFALQEIEVPTA